MEQRDELLDEEAIEDMDVELDEDLDEAFDGDLDEEGETPRQMDPTIAFLHRVFARDVDPNDHFHILLRTLMILGGLWYLGSGLYGMYMGS